MKVTKQQMIIYCKNKYTETNDPKWKTILKKVEEFWMDNCLYTPQCPE